MQVQCRIFLLILFCKICITVAYKSAKVNLEILNSGFRVSIPDSSGIKYVAFNVNRNRPFNSFEPGEFSALVQNPTNNRWQFKVNKKLDVNDVIYVWTNVQHNQLLYRSLAQSIPVNAAKQSADIDRSTVECERSITVAKDGTFCKGDLIFEDDFEDMNSLTKWQHEVRFPLDSLDAEFLLYDTKPKVRNSELVIAPITWEEYKKPPRRIEIDRDEHLELIGCTGFINAECKEIENQRRIHPPIITQRINTKGSFRFKYGRVEIRAKFPQGDWLLPLLLLEPWDKHYGKDRYESGVMRIAFARGNGVNTAVNFDGRTLYGGVIVTAKSDKRQEVFKSITMDSHFGNDYHVYEMEWTDQNVTLKVDNKQYGVIEGGFGKQFSVTKWPHYMAPFDQEFYITLGLSVGGHYDFPDEMQNKPWKNTNRNAMYDFWSKSFTWKPTWKNPELKIDYIRVYAV